ncbi:MAG: glycosyltransferase family 2 protein [Candidatus Omnitrophica bacterium]|nr:glycosyltransferase family 2 protein [Candidatus Omnitrophota bacterium]MBU1996905.1 glycosyltransferase family 2 protein [Candidatus Omnitrophota bacterium]MBU4333927.1 glycosyltransferase family 2 protein [Candidatus Omnitrophota bacterium]
MPDSFISKGVLDCSIVVPVYNEEESLRELFGEILKIMTPLKKDYEVIFVDDCSSDASEVMINDFCREFPEVAKKLTLSERSGQTQALRRGLDSAIGKIVISLDADLQNDPGDILRLLDKMEEGYDCVCGWRKARQDTILKAAMSKFGNVMQRLFTGMKIHDVSCTLRAYKKECVGKIALNWEGQHRFIPLSLSLQGYRVGEIVSNHRKRKYGYSKYNHRRVFRVVVDFFRVLSVRGTK